MFAKAIADFNGDLMIQQQQQQQQQQQEQEQEQQTTKYLNFNTDDVIYVKHQFENGWWYGCVYKSGIDVQNSENDGYLPSNYVKPVEVKRPKMPPPSEEPTQSEISKNLNEVQNDQNKDQNKNKDLDYKEYAKELIEKERRKQLIHYYIKSQSELEMAKYQLQQQQQQQQQQQLLEQQKQLEQKAELEKLQSENRVTDFNKRQSEILQEEMEREFGVNGYKKIKITEENKQSLLSNPEIRFDGQGQYAYVSIKDQSQVAKAYRQMNHYFNYDQWNDQMNKQQQKKAKPDPSRKKDMKAEKMNKLLSKIG